MSRILNPWTSTKTRLNYYHESEPIFKLGDYAIYKQWGDCWLYTYKDMAITQLAGKNKDLIKQLADNERPEPYTPQTFLFDRCKQSLQKCYDLLKIHSINI